ncbi:hypothetical protein HHL11_07040 [Ramlibacter sp. G-1-2-2]|uniref:Uncharacterized protein n=1 Tax=Ramlibacter agri TaxID=2728837 RepID=A0A848GZB1_9BURK|nr:hypothetical protein [Ramlibacter agri]NML43497.1 hypothetical protein [Ramlibacter agri]
MLQQRNGCLLIPQGVEPAQATDADIHVIDDHDLMDMLELAEGILGVQRVSDTSDC